MAWVGILHGVTAGHPGRGASFEWSRAATRRCGTRTSWRSTTPYKGQLSFSWLGIILKFDAVIPGDHPVLTEPRRAGARSRWQRRRRDAMAADHRGERRHQLDVRIDPHARSSAAAGDRGAAADRERGRPGQPPGNRADHQRQQRPGHDPGNHRREQHRAERRARARLRSSSHPAKTRQ